MSREKKFHELIEAQDREEKDRVWKRIEAMEAERLAKKAAENSAPTPKKPTHWKIWTAVSGVAVACAITLSIVLPLALTPKSPEDEFRFCNDEDYKIVQITTTIKDYARQEGKGLLYFDWYAETDYCINELYQLTETEEVICIRESIVDINTGCLVDICITDDKTQIDYLEKYKENNIKSLINKVEVFWINQTEKAFAHFEYKDHMYYLQVEEPIDENHILNLVEELLPDA